MTIHRELQSATVKAYDLTVDAYGQLQRGTPTTRTCDMTVKTYMQQNVQDPRYVDVELIGLTKENIVPGEVVSLAQGDYRVKYVINSHRWNEIMLTKI